MRRGTVQRACVLLLDIRGELAGGAAGFLPGRESPAAGRNKPLHARGGSGPSTLRENAPRDLKNQRWRSFRPSLSCGGSCSRNR